jgi:hypothetical protein
MSKTPTNNGQGEIRHSGRRTAGYALAVVVCALAVGAFFLIRNTRKVPAPPPVTAQVMQLDGGWGYKIEVNHRLYIYQDEIPCLPGKHLFPTRQSAMAVAQMVREKLIQGKSPAVTRAELEQVMPIAN